MSDSILYLAIVAIWAGFLIPAWVRRPHAARMDDETELPGYEASDGYDAGAGAEAGAPFSGAGLEGARNDSGDARNSSSYMGADTPVNVHNGNSEYRDDVHTHNYGHPDARAASSDAHAASSDAQAGMLDEGSGMPDPQTGPLDARAGSLDARAAAPGRGPSQSREQMMRARRRMFTILAGLVLITGLFVMAGVVQWWICVPPVAMLVLYVLLLREIAMADAELAAKKRAWEARQAAAARAEEAERAEQARAQSASAWKRSHLVWEAEQAQPGAQIIDISSRVGDQLYDQYADAAVRAVGD